MTPTDEAKVERRIEKLRQTNVSLARRLEEAHVARKDLVEMVYRAATEAAQSLDVRPVEPPPKRRKHAGTPEYALIALSDLQLGKRTPTYNTVVCERRVQEYARKVRELTDIQRSNRPIDEARVYMLGDMVEGEVIFPGQAFRIDASLYRQVTVDGPRIVTEFLRDLLSHFKKVHVVSVIGNHGRLGKRGDYHPESNSDLMLYRVCKTLFETMKEPRLTWEIPFTAGERSWYAVDVIGRHRYMLFHGDQMRGGGFAGIPMYGFSRALQAWASGVIPKGFRYALCGHWHSMWSMPINNRILWVNGCFPAGAPVITPEGPRAIETLGEGDSVLSRDGTVQRVRKVWRNEATSLVYLGVKGLPKELALTPSHRVWAIKGQDANCKFKRHDRPAMTSGSAEADVPQWVAAELLSAGDWVHAPFPTQAATESCDPDLAWVYGLYLAEGHSTVDGGRLGRVCAVHFNMHQREAITHLARAKSVLDRHFDQGGHIYVRPSRHTSTLTYSGRANAEKWKIMFGHGAHNKFVPEHFHRFTPEVKRAVVQGWLDGDGTKNKLTGVVSGSTVSARLAWGIYMLASAAGMEPFIADRGSSDRPMPNRHYEVSLTAGQDVRWHKSERFLRVCHRRHGFVAVPVYDLEVDGEHSYVVNGVGVHNSTESDNTWVQEELKARSDPGQWLLFAHPHVGVTSEYRVWLK